MSPLLVVTGPPGAGKSAVAEVLARAAPHSVLVEGDAFFGFLASGAIEPWLPESNDPNIVVTKAAASAAGAFARGGYATVYDGVIGPRIEAVDVVADLGPWPKALQVAVARIREPDRAVALHDHVVRRVEPQAAPVGDQRLDRAAGSVDAGDGGMLRSRALLTGHQASLEVEGHAVCNVGVLADGRDAVGLEREAVAIQGDPLQPHPGSAGGGTFAGVVK